MFYLSILHNEYSVMLCCQTMKTWMVGWWPMDAAAGSIRKIVFGDQTTHCIGSSGILGGFWRREIPNSDACVAFGRLFSVKNLMASDRKTWNLATLEKSFLVHLVFPLSRYMTLLYVRFRFHLWVEEHTLDMTVFQIFCNWVPAQVDDSCF